VTEIDEMAREQISKVDTERRQGPLVTAHDPLVSNLFASSVGTFALLDAGLDTHHLPARAFEASRQKHYESFTT
ncbi:MAG: hypothetical protein Q9183_007444, partial [Haloplaca sp. 2 TL-2023]